MSTPTSSRSPLTWLWRPALVLLITGLLGWWMLSLSPRRSSRDPAPQITGANDADASPPPERAWQPREFVEPAPGCTPESEYRCVEGDSWWVDSCGVTYAKAEECGARRCDAGECEPEPPPGCGGVPVLGYCDDNVAHGCEAGYPYAVDCAALGRRCVSTEEGPLCRMPSENACDPATLSPHCDGVELVTCFEGERERVDCRSFGAICGQPPGGAAAACLQLHPPVQSEDCDDACGCPIPANADEVCDGIDNDGDGWIDESGICPPVDLVFFVVTDERGDGSYARDDIDQEMSRLQRYFSRDDEYGIELRLADVILLPQPEWLELDPDDLDQLMRSGSVAGRRDDLYVPIVLTERVLVEDTPRPGLSTVPNGMCGGLRRVAGPQPALGVVALAKRRWDTTAAHELGHFFGLCHTHADHPLLVLPLDPGEPDDSDDDEFCVEPCLTGGDGICDTPSDPGPSHCVLGDACAIDCEDGSAPDPGNLMGYYPACRLGFSQQQALLMRQTIAQRRGWYRCSLGDGCPCEIGGECPQSMSCRRFTGDDGPYQRCVLDGPVVPGGVCRGSLECSQGAQCIGQVEDDPRCVRPCTDETIGCRCAEVGGVTHPICVGDLGR